jgi:hypothetical protein
VAEWSINPHDFIKGPIENIEKVRRIYAFEIFRRVVMATPVDTGNARSNWMVSVGEPTDEYNPATVTTRTITRGENKGKTITKTKLSQNLNRTMKAGSLGIIFSGDDSIYISNSTPYIRKLEYGGYGDGPKTVNGFSRQAPQGMVGKVMAQVGQIFRAAVNAVKGGGV